MTRILIEALWTIEDCNCLIWSLNLQIFPAGQNFFMDRDWIIHARLCHLCPGSFTLVSNPSWKNSWQQTSQSLQCTPSQDSGTAPFKLALVIWGTNSPQSQLEFSQWALHLPSPHVPCPCQPWLSSGSHVIQHTEASCSRATICSRLMCPAAHPWHLS